MENPRKTSSRLLQLQQKRELVKANPNSNQERAGFEGLQGHAFADSGVTGEAPQFRRRESKRNSKGAESAAERMTKLLKLYNDLKTQEESKEIGNRQVYLRRISLRLVHHKGELYAFPVLHFVEETSRILLMHEIDLTYWYHLLKTYLKLLDGSQHFTYSFVRLLFFETAMFVKRFLLQRMAASSSYLTLSQVKMLWTQIDSIEAYIKTYHFSNFDKAYAQFDKQDQLLLDPKYKLNPEPRRLPLTSEGQTLQSGGYESRCYLGSVKLAKINKIFCKLRQPFETDEKSNIIDYNWHVDNILKNSQSYNKDSEIIDALTTPTGRQGRLPVTKASPGNRIIRKRAQEARSVQNYYKGMGRRARVQDLSIDDASQDYAMSLTPQKVQAPSVSRSAKMSEEPQVKIESNYIRNGNDNDSTYHMTPQIGPVVPSKPHNFLTLNPTIDKSDPHQYQDQTFQLSGLQPAINEVGGGNQRGATGYIGGTSTDAYSVQRGPSPNFGLGPASHLNSSISNIYEPFQGAYGGAAPGFNSLIGIPSHGNQTSQQWKQNYFGPNSMNNLANKGFDDQNISRTIGIIGTTTADTLQRNQALQSNFSGSQQYNYGGGVSPLPLNQSFTGGFTQSQAPARFTNHEGPFDTRIQIPRPSPGILKLEEPLKNMPPFGEPKMQSQLSQRQSNSALQPINSSFDDQDVSNFAPAFGRANSISQFISSSAQAPFPNGSLPPLAKSSSIMNFNLPQPSNNNSSVSQSNSPQSNHSVLQNKQQVDPFQSLIHAPSQFAKQQLTDAAFARSGDLISQMLAPQTPAEARQKDEQV